MKFTELFPKLGLLSEEQVAILEELIGTKIKNPAYYEQALLHASYWNDHPEQDFPHITNERLEFLGDAILGFVVAEKLFFHDPPYSEGELTSLRAQLVNKKALAYCARKIKLEQLLFVGKSVNENIKNEKSFSVLADSFEAMIAAIYLDLGMQRCKQFIERHVLTPLLDLPEEERFINFKSILLEYVQQHFHDRLPEYRVIAEEGPDHDKTYIVELTIPDFVHTVGKGKTKRDAEQQAAYKAVKMLGIYDTE